VSLLFLFVPKHMTSELPKQGPDSMPEAVYFDTNALYAISHGTTDAEYLALRSAAEKVGAGLFAPEVVVREWTRRLRIDSRDEMVRLRQAAAKIGRNLGRTPLSFEEPGDVASATDEIMARRLADARITSVPTPSGISLGPIIEMAIERIPPFEEKGEKGFRDTMLLLTIENHMTGSSYANGILVTADKVFGTPGVAGRMSGAGLNLLVAANYADATNLLESQRAYAERARLERWLERVRIYLDGHFSEISAYIQDHLTSIPETYLIYDENHPCVKELLRVTPKTITQVKPGLLLSNKPYHDDIGEVTAYVAADFDVVALPYDRLKRGAYARMTVTHDVIVELHIDVEDGTPVGFAVMRLDGSTMDHRGHTKVSFKIPGM